MFRDVDEWIKGCKNCILRKLFINIRVFLISIEILEVLELVCLDYFFLEMLKGGYQNILVIIDYFMCYVVVVLICNQIVKIIVEVFFNNFVVYYGFLKRIYFD